MSTSNLSKVTRLRELNLDFALDFGTGPVPEELLTNPSFWRVVVSER